MTRTSMDELGPARLLSRSFLQETTLLEGLEDNRFLIRWREQELIVVREGRCEYLRCNALCCSMLCLRGPWTPYLAGFAIKGRASPLVRIPCRFLQEDLTCRRWKENEFPENCRNFPVPGDPMYLEVMEQCSFSFFLIRRNAGLDALTS